MKSAYEKALERMGGGAAAPKLTEAQRKQMAELDSVYTAKIAERETFLRSRIEQARAEGDAERLAKFQEELARDLSSLRIEWEQKKEKARTT